MAVSQNSKYFTFTVETKVTADDKNLRWKVVSTAKLTVKVWAFRPGPSYTITVDNGDSGTGKIQGGVTYGNNRSNVTYKLGTVTTYYSYSTSSRKVKVSASSSGSITSGGYGPGRLSYSGSVTLPAKFSSKGNLECTKITQASATVELSDIPSKTGYTRSITWYRDGKSYGSTSIPGTSSTTSYTKTFSGLLPGKTYTFKATIKTGSTTIATKSVTETTPRETGKMTLDRGTTYISVVVDDMFENPNYTRTVKTYYREKGETNYNLYSSATTKKSKYEVIVDGLISNKEYEIKVEICNGTTVYRSFTGAKRTIKDESLIPLGFITNVTQKLGTRKLTVSWSADKQVAGTKYAIECKNASSGEWTELLSLNNISSPVEVTSPYGNSEVLLRIKSTNPSVTETTRYSAEYSIYVRDDFVWDVPKEIGQPIKVTTAEWNRLSDYVMSKCRQAGISINISPVKQGEMLTAEIFNQTRDAIEKLTPTGVESKIKYEAIDIEDFDKLRVAINKA